MKHTILYIDACPRRESRTRRLADALIKTLDGEVERLSLSEVSMPDLDDALVIRRNKDCKDGNYADPMYRFAKQFAAADEIVIAAPFWDLSFPAILKKYIETISVKGITFRYSDVGVPIGMCKAKKLHYVTTAGGPTFGNDFGFGYVKTMAQVMYGIPEVTNITVENMDVEGADAEKMLQDAIGALKRA